MQLATAKLAPYSSKFSPHTYTQPQLAVLYCLKLKLGTSYRDLCDWLQEMPRLQEVLGLKQLPHYTTIQKAFERMGMKVWRWLHQASMPRQTDFPRIVALDSSGWERSRASRHYTQRIKLKIKALKVTFLVDIQSQSILDVHLTTTRKHDTQIAPKLTKRSAHRFKVLLADKGYDDDTFRIQLRRKGKRPLIKHRVFKRQDKAANTRMKHSDYPKRSLVETVMSVLKRKYGSTLSSRVWWRQFRELLATCVVYNLQLSR